MLSDYLKEEWIKLEVEAENWEDAIEKAGIDLVRDKVIRKKYEKQIIFLDIVSKLSIRKLLEYIF